MAWELHVDRQGEHVNGTRKRTHGTYKVIKDGVAVPGLSGWMIEPQGPGDNTQTGVTNKRRIAAGTYPLQIHTSGSKYATIGYKPASAGSTATKLPSIQVPDANTGSRTAILVHSTHDPFPPPDQEYDRWLSSVGCLNPTKPLAGAADKMDFADSHARMVALIDSLKAYAPATFAAGSGVIPNAKLIITD